MMISKKNIKKLLSSLFCVNMLLACALFASCDHSPEDEETTTEETTTTTTTTTEFSVAPSETYLYTANEVSLTNKYDGSALSWNTVGIPASELAKLGMTASSSVKVTVTTTEESGATYTALCLMSFSWSERTDVSPAVGTNEISLTAAQVSTFLTEGLAFSGNGVKISSIKIEL